MSEEKIISFTYTPDSVSFVCPDCGVLLTINRRSRASLSGAFCNCREQYVVPTNDGIVMKGTIDMGGKPNPGTPKDRRLKGNNPNAGKPKQSPPAMPMQPPKKGGKQRGNNG